MTALCTARGCPNPTQTMLCAGCLAALVDALRALARGVVERRADPIEFEDELDEHAQPTGRKRATDSRVVIPVDDDDKQLLHLAYLPADQHRRQGLLDDLQDTVTRTDNISPSGVGRVRGADVSSVEFHVAASHLADRVRNTISTWARDVHESNPHLHLPRTHIEAAAWLAGLPGILAMHPAAGEMHDQIVPLVDRVERMVDLRPDLTYLGICSARIGDAECDWDVFAERDDTVVQCRSKACGATHEVEYRKGVMLTAMQDQLLTAVDMRTALTRYMPQGVPSVNTIRSWAHRKRLIQRSPLPGGDQPRYRVGDVLDLIARQERDGAGKVS